MMPPERTDQPSRVSTTEIPRAPDEHVTTSDLAPPSGQGPRAPGSDTTDAAATPQGQSADDQPAPAAGDDEGTPQPPRRPRDRNRERRFGRLTAQLAAADARNAELEVRLAAIEQKVSETPAPPPPPKPKLADFKTQEEYGEAYAAWKTKNAAPATPPQPAPTERKERPTPAARPTKAGPTDEELRDFQTRGKERLGDEFMAAIQEGTATNQLMAEFCFDSDYGPDVYVHLVNNPEIARTIYAAEPADASRELRKLERQAKAGKLDLEIESAPLYDADERKDEEDDDEPAPPPPRRTTKAPTPPSDTRPGNAPAGRPNLERMPMDDYAQMRLRDLARKQGRILQ